MGKPPAVFDGKPYLALTPPAHKWLKFPKLSKEGRQGSMLLQLHLPPTTAGTPIQSTYLPDRVKAYITYKGQQLLSEFELSKNSPFGRIHICTIERLVMEKWKVLTCVSIPPCPQAPTALTSPFINSISIFQVLY